MKKIFYIFLAGMLALTGCHVIDIDSPSGPDQIHSKDLKVPVELSFSVPNDGPSTRAMNDKPQIKNIVVAVFGGSGYFNEWVPAEAETEYATENEVVYKLKVKLSMSESRLRLHIIANCPSNLVSNPPITGNSSQDLEDIVMAKVRSRLGDTYNGSNIEDGYWQKVYIPYGIAAEIDPHGNGDNAYLKDENGNLIPTTLTVNQFKMVSPIPLVRNFARVQLVNNAEDVTISHIGVAYAPAEGMIAPTISTPYKVDEWGARVSVVDGATESSYTVYPVKADKVYSFDGVIDNPNDPRIPGLHVLGHELKDPETGADQLLGATTGSVYNETFVTNYQNLPLTQPAAHNDWRLLTEAPYNYGGYSPTPITFAPNPQSNEDGTVKSGFQEYNADGYVYVYERTKPRTYSNQTEKATRLIIRARKGNNGPYKYYPIDIVDSEGNSVALLRNFTYIVTLTGIADGTGETSAEVAADATGANVSADPRTQDLNEVSDGTSSIVVSYIDTTAIASGTYSVMYKFIPNVNAANPSQSNKDVTLQVGYDGTSAGFVPGTSSSNGDTFAGGNTPSVSIEGGSNPTLYVPNGNGWKVATTDAEKRDAWSKIIYTTVGTAGQAFSYNSNGTIRVTGTRANGQIYRDVRVNIIKKKTMQVECADKYIQAVAGSAENLVIRIPDDITRSMFPLEFKIQAADATITPREGDNLPVSSGKSTVPGKETQSAFFFVKTLTRQDYEALESVGGWKEFTCKFKSTKDASATTIYVTNEYFNQGSDDFYNYDLRYFTDAEFSRSAANQEEVNFRFTMDKAHNGTAVWDSGNITSTSKVIPRQVTVKLTGLTPRTNDSGNYIDGGLVRKLGAPEGYYIYNVPNLNQASWTPVLHFTATADTYSVELSTIDLGPDQEDDSFIPNPKLYEPLVVDQDEVATGGGSTSITLESANTVTQDNVTLAFSNCQWVGYYYGTNYGIGLSSGNYSRGSVTVSVPEGYKLNSITFSFTYNAGDMSASDGYYSRNGNNATWTPPADGDGIRTVTLTNTSRNNYRYVLTFNVAYSSTSGSDHAFE